MITEDALRKYNEFMSNFVKQAEVTLAPLIAEAKKHYGDDEAAYIYWLQRAELLKRGVPHLPFSELTPAKLDRTPAEIKKDILDRKMRR